MKMGMGILMLMAMAITPLLGESPKADSPEADIPPSCAMSYVSCMKSPTLHCCTSLTQLVAEQSCFCELVQYMGADKAAGLNSQFSYCKISNSVDSICGNAEGPATAPNSSTPIGQEAPTPSSGTTIGQEAPTPSSGTTIGQEAPTPSSTTPSSSTPVDQTPPPTNADAPSNGIPTVQTPPAIKSPTPTSAAPTAQTPPANSTGCGTTSTHKIVLIGFMMIPLILFN